MILNAILVLSTKNECSWSLNRTFFLIIAKKLLQNGMRILKIYSLIGVISSFVPFFKIAKNKNQIRTTLYLGARPIINIIILKKSRTKFKGSLIRFPFSTSNHSFKKDEIIIIFCENFFVLHLYQSVCS